MMTNKKFSLYLFRFVNMLEYGCIEKFSATYHAHIEVINIEVMSRFYAKRPLTKKQKHYLQILGYEV